MMNFGEYIRDARKKQKMTLVDFAGKVGISSIYASQIEANKFQPSMDRFEQIVRVLGLDLRDALEKSGRWPEYLQRSAKRTPQIIELNRNLFDGHGAVLPLSEKRWETLIVEFARLAGESDDTENEKNL
jgi:transcriptional regulator with XRE-family HTH domain